MFLSAQAVFGCFWDESCGIWRNELVVSRHLSIRADDLDIE